jgi:hypothetical protein
VTDGAIIPVGRPIIGSKGLDSGLVLETESGVAAVFDVPPSSESEASKSIRPEEGTASGAAERCSSNTLSYSVVELFVGGAAGVDGVVWRLSYSTAGGATEAELSSRLCSGIVLIFRGTYFVLPCLFFFPFLGIVDTARARRK